MRNDLVLIQQILESAVDKIKDSRTPVNVVDELTPALDIIKDLLSATTASANVVSSRISGSPDPYLRLECLRLANGDITTAQAMASFIEGVLK